MKDTIIADLRKIRDKHAARFNYDIDAIAADLRRREKGASRKLVNRKPKRIDVSLVIGSNNQAAGFGDVLGVLEMDFEQQPPSRFQRPTH